MQGSSKATVYAQSAVLVDFGSAKRISAVDEDITGQHGDAAPLTLRYASPEQFDGLSLTSSSDIYCLGLIAFELVAGAPPYSTEGNEYRIVVDRMTKKPYTLSEIDPSFDWPPGLQLVFDRVLAQAPAERFESAGQFAEEFLQVVQSSFGGIA